MKTGWKVVGIVLIVVAIFVRLRTMTVLRMGFFR